MNKLGMNMQHTLDATAFMSQAWLIDPEMKDIMLAQLLNTGSVTLSMDDTPIHYADYGYAYYRPASQKGSVAIVTIKGVIYDYYATYICDQLRQVYADGNLAGMFVDLNSPGGSADAGYKISDMVAAAPFPTMGYISYGQAASAGYMVGASCDCMWASRPNDRVGSIGTYISYQDWSKYFEKMGIVSKDIYADQSTEKNLESRQAAKGNFKMLEEYVTAEAQGFIDYVNNRRTIDTSAGDPMKGKLFKAEEGLKNGLLDGIGDRQAALQALTAPTLSTKATPRTNMLFGYLKINALAAVKGLAPESITEAQVDAINKELQAEGFTGVAIVGATQFESAVNASTELATAQGQLTTANANVTRLTNELTEANNKVNSLTTENNTLKGQVVAETTTPGAEKTGGAQAEVKQPDAGESDDTAKAIAELPHNKALVGTWLG